MLWCHGWGLLPLPQNTWEPLPAQLQRDVHGKKQKFKAHKERHTNSPWCGELGSPCVLELLGHSAPHPQGSSSSSAFNSWLWGCCWSLTNPRAHRLGPECYNNSRMRMSTPEFLSWSSHLSVGKNTAPGFNCHRMAIFCTCSSTYLLVSNLITIQSRGKTLIFIRFRNTQKIFRRNSCHTGESM